GRSLKEAQAVLEKNYNSPMTEKEVHDSKTILIVFLVGHMMAPMAKYDYSSLTYWPALMGPGNILNYNWG
uniref:Uncharacterized protein n=1 Tax=Aegilops tauschii subsp. strangulata TaxID=200361 RepID=A0A453BWA1_AEGTS